MATEEFPPWADLPEPILTHVMSYLTLKDCFEISMVCKSWNQCLDSPILWRSLNCGFFFPWHNKILAYIKRYSCYVSRLTITLNQQVRDNCENAIKALNCFTDLSSIRLTHLQLSFKGQNRLFYSGQEFISALSSLLKKVGKSEDKCMLRHLNFSELQVDFDDTFIDCVSSNCKSLVYLNILNKMLICNVSPVCMKNMVKHCQNLQVLHIYHTSLSNDVLDALSQPDRTPLKRLGIVCRREEKYGEDLTSDAWSRLVSTNCGLKVELGFDHTCPLHRVAQIMKPEIPVLELHLATFTRIYPEINSASSFYEDSLEKLVVQTRPSKDLDDALLSLARRCHKLQSLLVYCIVDKAVIEQILELHPIMKRKGSYILKSELEPEPWTVGKEEGD